MNSCKDEKSRENNKNGISLQLVWFEKEPGDDFKTTPLACSITVELGKAGAEYLD
jgi:hypothetical protein